MGYLEEKARLKQRIKEVEEQISDLYELEMWMEYESNIPFYQLSVNPEYMKIMEKQKLLNEKISGYKKSLSALDERRKAEHSFDPYVPTDLIDLEITIKVKGHINGHMI